MVSAEYASIAEDTDVAASAASHRTRVFSDVFHDGGAVVGIVILAVVVALTLAAPLIARYNPDTINVLALNQSPSGAHWFGTDYLGRDLWARVLYGGRVALPAALGIVVLAAGIGIPIGLLAGYVAGRTDDFFMRVMDVLLAFPGIVFAIGVIAILGVGLTSAIIAIGVTSIPYYARFARATTLSVKEDEYIVAARVVGSTHTRVMYDHILPNVLGPLVILLAGNFGYAILATAALSYLGLGTQPPVSDWGVLMSQGYDHMFQAASEVIFPGAAIVLTVLGLNLLADGLTDAFGSRG